MLRRRQALRERQQDEDEGGEHRNGSKDAADQEVGGLLEQPEDEARDDRAAIVAHAAERDRDEAVEGQHRRIGKKGQQQLAPGKSRQRADHPGERKAREPQAALGQPERASRVIVLGDRQERMADQSVAIEQLERDDRHHAGDHRQPVLLVEPAARDVENARKRLRVGAELDRGELLHDQRERER